jgi:hypothetical protein
MYLTEEGILFPTGHKHFLIGWADHESSELWHLNSMRSISYGSGHSLSNYVEE